MRKTLVILLLLLPLAAAAEEGMWPPRQLPQLEEELRSLGLELPARKLADLEGHPLNAVVSLRGCSASFVSPDGLVVTNYHCVRGSVQYNSSTEANLLEQGFVAARREDELPAAPGTRVLVSVSTQDVTDRIIDERVEGLEGRERYLAIEAHEKALVTECERDEGHRCRVRSFHGGLRYTLTRQLALRDVRLVYAPPRSIGNFGGDTDNWMWPRHTGDFAFYRAWTGKDGKPADNAEDNRPYRPAHYLRVASRGLEQGDLVMVPGYPGRTSRYLLASEVDAAFNWFYPTRKQILAGWLEVLEAHSRDRPEVRIKYASLEAGLNNAAKSYQGLLDGFARGDLVERKRAEEERLQAWIDADSQRRIRFGSVLADLETMVQRKQAHRQRSLYYENYGGRSSLLSAARKLYRLAQEKRKPDAERKPGYQERDLRRTRASLTRLSRTYAPDVDRASWRMHIMNYAAIPATQHVAAFDSWFGLESGAVDEAALDARLDAMYAATRLGELEERMRLLEASASELDKSADPFVAMAVSLYESDLALEAEEEELEGSTELLRRRFMEALLAWRTSLGKPLYPDANGTLRLSYGRVQGYSPRDGVRYKAFTSLAGILEKQTGVEPYDAPAWQVRAIKRREHGEHAARPLGSVPVNFLTDTDTTGGSSGSATLNARGELVGLLFDGNYESRLSDWDFMPQITRSIHVDVRYLLWVLEREQGTERLLRELGAGRSRSDTP